MNTNEQIAEKLYDDLGVRIPKDRAVPMILQSIERATEHLEKQLSNVEIIQSRSSQPQPSKGSPASGLSQEDYDNLVRDAMSWRHQKCSEPRAQGSPASGERSEPKIGDWVKTSLDSEYSYEVADMRQFPHGIMIGIYDEPPSKHIDYWNPSNLYATAHHSEPRGQRVEGSCWIWQGSLFSGGYGKAKVLGKWKGAHRVSWEAFKGPVPDGKLVCHKCDTPACVNPYHLFLGSHAENIKDSYNKGRSNQSGEQNGNRRLSSEQVQEIRSSSESCRVLSERFGVGKSQIANIKKGTKWINP